MPRQIIRSWYSEEGPGQVADPPSPLLAVSNVTAHPSTASVAITVLLSDGPSLCGFNVASRGLIISLITYDIYIYKCCNSLILAHSQLLGCMCNYDVMVQIPGATMEDSKVLKGILINKDVTHPKMRR